MTKSKTTFSSGSIMYYIEFTETSKFSSILQSSWWAIVTMSTVGYGDMVPETPWGRSRS